MRLLKRGAEADILLSSWHGHQAVCKTRKPKGYRHPDLDSRIRRHRTMRESEMLCIVKSLGIRAPLVYFVDVPHCEIIMQHVDGTPIHGLAEDEIVRLSRQMGHIVGRLHRGGIMHGDLTTSNFLLSGDSIYVIDFGLASRTSKPEDHAVDLRLIKEILNSAHAPVMEESWRLFLAGYLRMVGKSRHSRILNLVASIEARGRYATVV